MFRKRLTVVIATTALLAVTAAPAMAVHDHYVETPNGKCHQVAQGQTAIEDAGHGGFHKFHFNVHKGAATDGILGKGHSKVNVGVGCP